MGTTFGHLCELRAGGTAGALVLGGLQSDLAPVRGWREQENARSSHFLLESSHGWQKNEGVSRGAQSLLGTKRVEGSSAASPWALPPAL